MRARTGFLLGIVTTLAVIGYWIAYGCAQGAGE